MKISDDKIHRIGQFAYSNDTRTKFPGCLFYDDEGNLCLSAQMKRETKDNHSRNGYDILGKIGNCDLTLVDSYIYQYSLSSKKNSFDVILKPSKIVIGSKYSDKNGISIIRTEMKQLDMFIPMEYDHRALWGYNGFPCLKIEGLPSVNATDEEGILTIGVSLKMSENGLGAQINRANYISYSYNDKHTLQDGIIKLATARNLLAFLADYYLDMDSFEVEVEKGIYFDVYSNFTERVVVSNDHFAVSWSKVSESFQEIWKKWLEFVASCRSISDLFYEILCERSNRVNAFLNLCQAIEVYSSNYREQEARAVRKYYLDQYSEKSKSVLLKHRLYDVLASTTICQGWKLYNIKSLSDIIANGRHYCTHYSKNRKKIEVEQIQLLVFFLRAVLLSVVYMHLGINEVDLSRMSKYRYVISSVKEMSNIKIE